MCFSDFMSMLGGLAVFLYGMQEMSRGLTGLAGKHMKKLLESWTEGRWRALFAGTVVTAALQSSSAVTVMVVGFVNAGILNLEQAVGITMGANIGTTLTAWIFAGKGGGNFVMPFLAAVGIVLMLSSRKEAHQKLAQALMGFALLIFGMHAMEEAAAPLAGSESFLRLLTGFEDPVRGVLGGCLMTAAIQSSSASVGILQVLCENGRMTYGAVIPIIMGQNIGTCITAMLASLGTVCEAKRAAWLNLYFNLIGTVGFLTVFYLIDGLHPLPFLSAPAGRGGIAFIHSGFNILSAVVLLPFAGGIVRLAELTVKAEGKKGAEGSTYSNN